MSCLIVGAVAVFELGVILETDLEVRKIKFICLGVGVVENVLNCSNNGCQNRSCGNGKCKRRKYSNETKSLHYIN